MKSIFRNLALLLVCLLSLTACSQPSSPPTETPSVEAESVDDGKLWIDAGNFIFAADDYEFSSFSGEKYYFSSTKTSLGDGHNVRAYEGISLSDIHAYLSALEDNGFLPAHDIIYAKDVLFNEKSLNCSSPDQYGGTEIWLTYDANSTILQTLILDESTFHIEQLKENISSDADIFDIEPEDDDASDAPVYAPPSDLPKDELIAESDGKQLWKVYTTQNQIRFDATFTGSGYFGIKLLDNNQELYDLVCNTIGDYVVDKTVSVHPGQFYYIEISVTDGHCDLTWYGTKRN